MSKQKFYLTTPIYYVNARPHIGHAYTTIAADVIARRHRLLGDDTFLLTGTDEHGQKVARSAAAAGVSPQQFTDQISASFKALWDRMGITYDDYIRTTEPRHTKAVQRLFQDLVDRDAIYLSTYTGQYSVGEEMFVDGPPGTIGPDGKPTETVTEENYFFRLSSYQSQLIDLIESNELLIQPEVRRNEVLSFLRGNISDAAETKKSKLGIPYVEGALKDLSISRTSFKWGIPVPGNEKHVIYVWLDALANYMTAIGYGSDDPIEQEKFKRYWPADLHLVGKEIIRFHCVYWPAFLLAAGLPLPKAITAHGWLLFEDSKMSKSRGNIVRTETILDAFGTLKPKPTDGPGAVLSDEYWKHEQDLFASDVLRYFLLREIPFGQDGSFSFDALVQRYNSDLANGYGNLVSRTLSMVEKYFDGTIPDPSFSDVAELRLEQIAQVGLEDFGSMIDFDNGALYSIALTDIWRLIGMVDGVLSKSAPWKLAKSSSPQDLAKLRRILYIAASFVQLYSAALYPFIPYATSQVWFQLGLGDIEDAARKGELKNLEWGGLKPGTKLGELAPIFPRAPKELIQLMTDMENNTNAASKPEPSKLMDEKTTHTVAVPTDSAHPGAAPRTSGFAEANPGASVGGSHAISTERPGTPSHTEAPASGPYAASAAGSAAPDTAQIAIDDFVKVDLRVAQVVVAERIPKADKLLRLEVDLGYEKRQILSGIAEWYTPEELIGRRIVVIANLAPRKMRGLESHGMLLAASNGEDGKPVLATFAEDIALGSRLK
ncbi:MAG TPA: methionine--tRNA ligase subunit beta [Edaphobacter sp.]|nr:methionine--tRNA ligase subunit beta [Edaphobacter sp.]